MRLVRMALCALLVIGIPASLPAAIQIWEEDRIEKEAKTALAEDPRDRDAIGRMVELCEVRGDFEEAATWLTKLMKTGVTEAFLESRFSDLRGRIAEEQDITIWESRLSTFREKEEWAKALVEIGKLKDRLARIIARLQKKQKAFEAQQAVDPDAQDPNVAGALSGYRARFQDLVAQEEEIKATLADR